MGITGTEIAMRNLGWIFIVAGALFGMLILLKIGGTEHITRLVYTGFDLSLVFMALMSVIPLLCRMSINERRT